MRISDLLSIIPHFLCFVKGENLRFVKSIVKLVFLGLATRRLETRFARCQAEGFALSRVKTEATATLYFTLPSSSSPIYFQIFPLYCINYCITYVLFIVLTIKRYPILIYIYILRTTNLTPPPLYFTPPPLYFTPPTPNLTPPTTHFTPPTLPIFYRAS